MFTCITKQPFQRLIGCNEGHRQFPDICQITSFYLNLKQQSKGTCFAPVYLLLFINLLQLTVVATKYEPIFVSFLRFSFYIFGAPVIKLLQLTDATNKIYVPISQEFSIKILFSCCISRCQAPQNNKSLISYERKTV